MALKVFHPVIELILVTRSFPPVKNKYCEEELSFQQLFQTIKEFMYDDNFYRSIIIIFIFNNNYVNFKNFYEYKC